MASADQAQRVIPPGVKFLAKALQICQGFGCITANGFVGGGEAPGQLRLQWSQVDSRGMLTEFCQ